MIIYLQIKHMRPEASYMVELSVLSLVNEPNLIGFHIVSIVGYVKTLLATILFTLLYISV